MCNNTIIYFIRHSEKLEIEHKTLEKIDNQIENEKIILSVQGEEKAKKLSELEKFKKIDVIYSSHYVRAVSTAKYIANKNNIKININYKLGERKLGDLKELKKLGETKSNDFTTEQLLDENLKNIGGESRLEVKNRMQEVLNSILKEHPKKHIAIISHGAALKYLFSNWCTLDESYNLKYKDCELKFTSPSAFEAIFNENNEMIDLKQIYC